MKSNNKPLQLKYSESRIRMLSKNKLRNNSIKNKKKKKEDEVLDEEIFANTFNIPLVKDIQEYNQTPQNELSQKAKSKNQSFISQRAINIEDLLIQEDKLWKILDNIRSSYNFNYASEEYLEFSNISSVQSFDNIFSNPKLNTVLNSAMIYEYIAGILCLFVYSKNKLNKLTVEHLKNTLYYTHQNLLLMFRIILNRLSKDFKFNIFASKLEALINSKKSTFMNNEIELQIQLNNDIIANMINNFIGINFNNEEDQKIFEIVNNILLNVSTSTVENVKSNLTNLKNMIIYCEESSHNTLNHSNLSGPFLPPINKKYTYTLVLDLDETLVHSLEELNSFPLIRPGALTFIEELAPYYEIVIFTAATQEYADSIIQILDKENKCIQYKLYRQHTTVLRKSYLKDIAKLGRDLSKTIIIDNARDNFQLQIENGIFISTWIDDKQDHELIDLLPLIKEIAKKRVSDVRKALRKIRDTMIRLYIKGDNSPYNTIISSISN